MLPELRAILCIDLRAFLQALVQSKQISVETISHRAELVAIKQKKQQHRQEGCCSDKANLEEASKERI
jgi:hypothetical protein